MVTKCIICGSPLMKEIETILRGHGTEQANIDTLYDCQRCGEFMADSLIRHALHSMLNNDNDKITLLSHAVRRMNRLLLTKDIVENILNGKLPNPAEQAKNLILLLGDNVKGPGEGLDLEMWGYKSFIGAKSENGASFIVEHLLEKGLIEKSRNSFDSHTLTFEGWKYYEDLKRGVIYSRKAVMAIELDDVALDGVVAEVFKIAVQRTGFDLYRLTDNPQAGLIDDRLRVEIRTSRFLIADLTHDNAGAYWVAGYAEGLGKPVIYTCEKAKFKENKTYFDASHHRAIVWDIDNLTDSGEKLKDTIRATIPEDAILNDE